MTPEQINQLLLTARDVGIAIVLALIVGLMVIAFIILIRSGSRKETSFSAQFEKAMNLLADALKRDDSETAKAVREVAETQRAFTLALDKNTAALEHRNQYSEMQVSATQESVNEIKALRTDLKEWPAATTTALDTLTRTVKDLQSSVGLLIATADTQRQDAKEMRAILEPIPSQLDIIRQATQQLLSAKPDTTEVFSLMREIKSHLPQPKDDVKPDEPTLPEAG